jgi:hypothetical protein
MAELQVYLENHYNVARLGKYRLAGKETMIRPDDLSLGCKSLRMINDLYLNTLLCKSISYFFGPIFISSC